MNKDKNNGFTLIEIIVVIAIIAILAAVAVPRLTGYSQTAKTTRNLASAESVFTAALTYDTLILKKGAIPGYPKAGYPTALETNPLEDGYNPGPNDIDSYIDDSKITVISGAGQPGTNVWGHKAPTEYGEVCVHIIRPGGTYRGAGLIDEYDKDLYIVEMYDPTAEKINSGSEENVRYYIYPEVERSN